MTFKKLFKYLLPYKKLFILSLLITTCTTIISIFTPKLLGDFITEIYEKITSQSNTTNNILYKIITILSILYILNIILTYLENYIINTISQNSINKIRNKTYKKLSKVNITYYNNHPKGEILSLFNNDLENISALFTQAIPKIINYSITFIGILIMMIIINPLLALITLTTLPLLIIISKILLKISKKKKEQYYQKITYLNSVITECYLNQEIISIYNNDELMCQNFEKLNKDLAKTNLKATLLTALLSPLAILLNYLTYLIIIVLGAKSVINGKMKFGEIQTLIQYSKQIGTPTANFSSLLTQIQNSLIAGKRVLKVLKETEETHLGKEQLTDIESIEFKNISFSYNQSPFIDNMNFKINKGEKIAIIGETGGGKSTIVNLIMQFYKTKNGNILINNKNIYDYNINSFYNQIAYNPQELWLLNDTIENNIKYGNYSLSKEEITKKIKLNEIIEKLPNKLNEIIDEHNQTLSQGEKQLLTITRTMLKPHSLLILDESTSNIDSTTEQLIQETINDTNKDKITLIIAHKISTITNADKIIVIKNGKIIEAGNHNDLYNKKGEYYNYLQIL